jgi:hypothetical protein
MLDLEKIRKSKNVADLFSDLQNGKIELQKIGRSIVRGVEIDDKSSESWRKSIDESMDIAKQIMNNKSFPWDGAANVKYPLICEAAINFASRTYPEIVPNDNIVRMNVVGVDVTGEKFKRGCRVEKCMSYQCVSSSDWKEHIDRLLHILPVVGTVFTKTYYSNLDKKNCVELCPPDQIIINHETTLSLDSARRVTHILRLSINDIISYQRTGEYCDCDINLLRPQDCDPEDNDFEIQLYEQHCWLDLDGDNYKEPYVVTVHPETNTVLRIVNRIKPKSIQKNGDGDIQKIEAINYFQDYHFIRSPDGGYYSMGFGQLLLPLNKAINSLINQLLDAGTISVTQGGFLGKGLRLKGGELRFKPFEWKVLDAGSGLDLKQNVFPFPVREPSSTLLSLLTLLINIGKELTASTEAMNGTMNPNNVANQTLEGLIEQGSKVLKAINHRLYDSLTKSFKKLYELNYYYLSDKEYQNILDEEGVSVKKDFDLSSNDIQPVADPELSTMDQRLRKGSILMSLQTVDRREIEKYILESLQFDQEQIKKFQPPPDPNQPPPPEAVKLLADAGLSDAKKQEIILNNQLKGINAPLEAAKIQKDMEWIDTQKNESQMRSWKTMKDAAHNDQKIMITGSKMTQEEQLKQLQEQFNQVQSKIDSLLKDKELNIKAADNVMKHDVALEKIKNEKEKKQNPIV